MQVSMIAVVSLDGCLTRHEGAGASGWASKEDQVRYKELSGSAEVQLFGAGTYREHRDVFRRSAATGPRKIILTRQPEAFASDAVPGRLEFSAEPPAALIDRLRAEGVATCAVLGGGQIYNEYLAAGVIDVLHLTLEPVVFGTGIRLAGASTPIEARLALRSVEHLNESTLFLTYQRR